MALLGGITVLEQKEMTAFPQKAASAWSAMNGFVGAKYKPMAYVGTQIVKGVNHIFVAEQTLVTTTADRHIVLITVNEFDGKFELAMIERIV
ncbi:MAG: hypothetical protein IJ668_04535 [Selenomonadaceae bacterium]|nr:hypothetical protein [Selenomonadaceae bacterium]